MSRFIEKSLIVHDKKYGYSLVDYKNNFTKIKIICPQHGVFEQIPKDHLKGRGCKKCGIEKLSVLNSFDVVEFVRRALIVHDKKYGYSLVDYKNNSTKIKIICPQHGVFEQIPKNHLKGNGCYKCTFEHTNNDFIQKAISIHQNKYDYSLVDYKNHKIKIKIICPSHGTFLQRPADHLSGSGCSICGKQNSVNILKNTKDEFIKNAISVHGNRYVYNKIEYSGCFNQVKIMCREHGEFCQTPSNHLKGTGCPICAINKCRLNVDDILYRAEIIHNKKYKYELKNYKNSSSKISIKCNHHGWFKQRVGDHLDGHGCPQCFHPTSKWEKELFDYIKSIYCGEVSANTRKIITPYELDIYVPELRLAIECDGIRWHSYDRNETTKEKLKHQSKHQMCANKGIKLLQIWESEWNTKKDIVKSMIKNAFKLSNKIYARKCFLLDLNSDDFDVFMKNNHLQGSISSKYRIGLYHDLDLICVIGFNHHTKYEYEITRIASKIGLSVVGGVSKILKHFMTKYDPDSLLTFANARYSIGDVYKKLGFKYIKLTKPGYYYVKSSTVKHRIHFQKHKLQNKLDVFDKNKTEAENMFDNGYRRLWDSGNYKFLWSK